jgi:hypothetical protein
MNNSKLTKTLHQISHLKWIFIVWILGMFIYTFFSDSQHIIGIVGSVIFASGLMMGFSSLSDNSKLSQKELTALANPKYAKRVFKLLLLTVIILVLISFSFFGVRFIFPTGDPLGVTFQDLGFDCLVMLLGFLCLIKQFSDQSEYAAEMQTELSFMERNYS